MKAREKRANRTNALTATQPSPPGLSYIFSRAKWMVAFTPYIFTRTAKPPLITTGAMNGPRGITMAFHHFLMICKIAAKWTMTARVFAAISRMSSAASNCTSKSAIFTMAKPHRPKGQTK